MKPHITDKIWVRLTELSPHDVDEPTAARIRERALRALTRRPHSRAADLVRQVERVWTEFVELPVAGVVVVACLMWVFQGVANGRSSNDLAALREAPSTLNARRLLRSSAALRFARASSGGRLSTDAELGSRHAAVNPFARGARRRSDVVCSRECAVLRHDR